MPSLLRHPAPMRRRALLLLSTTVLATCSTAASESPPETAPVLALTGVTVIDGTGAAPRPGMSVVVAGGRITGLFPTGSEPLPPGAEVLDLAGHYVIPGLIDSHAHLATFDRGEVLPALLESSLMGGVTSVRDMGGNTARVAELAREARADDARSPRIFYSAVVAGPGCVATYDAERLRYWSGGARPGTAPGVRLLADDGEIQGIVDEAVRLGATGLKVYSDVPPARLRALAEAAHRRGLRVWAHAVVPPSRPGEVAAAGVDVVSHADQLIWAAAGAGDSVGSRAVRSGLLAAVSPGSPRVTALLEEMRARGTLLDPTLLIVTMAAENAREDGGGAGVDSLLSWAVEATRRAHRAGVPLVAGTDALGTETPNIHSELQILVRRAGLTPLEAIRAATEHGARALGAQDSLGTIAVGKLADLVVLRADPSADIRNTQTIAYVMRGGRLHRREGEWQTPQLAEPPRR